MTTWVSRAAVNCVKDAIDYKMKRLAISEPLIFAEDEDSDDTYCLAEHCDKRIGFNPDMLRALTEYSPDKHLDQVQFEESVRRETRKLSDKNQHYLRMLEDGCTPKEMARREGCTPNSAAKRIFDIRKALKETLAEIARDFDVICEKLVC
jgi:DNA-directed RNA polymerase specialized sigma24 family protein